MHNNEITMNDQLLVSRFLYIRLKVLGEFQWAIKHQSVRQHNLDCYVSLMSDKLNTPVSEPNTDIRSDHPNPSG